MLFNEAKINFLNYLETTRNNSWRTVEQYGRHLEKFSSFLLENNLKNLVNQKFGLLTVLSYEYTKKTPSGASKIFWKCKCDCGNEAIIEGNALRTGNTKSCGCIKSFGEQKISSILL